MQSIHTHLPSPPPMFVRLAAMRGIDDGYRAAPSDEREAYHSALAYFSLLTETERLALSRCFPSELASPPSWLPGGEHTRPTWDARSRELVVAMLVFGERARAAGLEYARRVDADEEHAIMGLTAAGSTFELGRPDARGVRSVVCRSEGQVEEHEVVLTAPLEVGRPLRLGDERTSDLVLVARGPELPPAFVFPTCATTRAEIAELRTRLKGAVEAVEKSAGATRRLLQDKAVALACEIQRKVAPRGGYQLRELAWFETGSGSRYEVMQHDDLDLVRRAPDEAACVWMHRADIGAQTIVDGAPLVIFYSGARLAEKVAFVFNIAASKPHARATGTGISRSLSA